MMNGQMTLHHRIKLAGRTDKMNKNCGPAPKVHPEALVPVGLEWSRRCLNFVLRFSADSAMQFYHPRPGRSYSQACRRGCLSPTTSRP